MAAGELFVKDVSEIEEDDLFALESDGRRRLIRREEHPLVEIHASREARWHRCDVAGARPIVVFSILRRLLSHDGFATRLAWGRPDGRRGVFRSKPPAGCKLDRPQTMTSKALQALGLDRPDAEPLMGRWAASPCHGVLLDGQEVQESWVHGWDAGHPGLLAQLFVEWEALGAEDDDFVDLDCALASAGPHAIVMYLLGTRYGELLAPTGEGLQRAKRHVKKIDASLERLRPGEPSPPALAPIRDAFEDALHDDLDTPSAFLALFDWIRESKTSAKRKVGDEDLRRMLWLLGMARPTPALRKGAERSLSGVSRRRRTA